MAYYSSLTLMQGTREDNNRKRKREQKLSSVEETEAKDITIVLPFAKKLPIWKTVESMEVFKTFPQSPHFIPLLEIREDAREISAVGMMLTFSGLLEEVKSLKLNNRISTLNSLLGSNSVPTESISESPRKNQHERFYENYSS